MTKIRFWATVGAAYGFAFAHLGQLLRAAGVWIAGCVVLEMALLLVSQRDGGEIMLRASDPIATILLTAALSLFGYAATIAFAVAWHRLVLTEERRDWLAALRFKGREWRFMFYGWAYGSVLAVVAWIVIVAILRVAVAMLPEGSSPSRTYLVIAVYAVAASVALFAVVVPFSRLALGFPAIALEEPSGVWRRSWRRGKGNSVRLAFGIALSGAPMVATTVLAIVGQRWLLVNERLGDVGFAGHAGEFALAVIYYLVRFGTYAVAVSFLSLCYRQLVPRETNLAEGA